MYELLSLLFLFLSTIDLGAGKCETSAVPGGPEVLHFPCVSWRRPKRVRRFDSVPPRPSGPTICPVCREDLGSLQALHSHYLSCHAVRDNRLTTRPSFQCSRCSGIFGSTGGLQRHVCSSGDKLLEARQVGAVAATVGRPPCRVNARL